jgi:hypothetical protein
MSLLLDGTNGLSDVDGTAATPAIRGTDANTGIFFPAADTIAFSEGGVESARFDSSGNFGIGTTAPGTVLNVVGTTGIRVRGANSASNGALDLRADNTACTINANTFDAAVPLVFQVSSTERARIDTAGNFLVGTTSTNPIAARTNGIALLRDFISMRGITNNMALGISTSSGTNIAFYTDNGSTFVTAGNISSSGALTSFNTSSDYRMKENVQPMVGALDKVLALKPVTYTWKPEFAGINASGQGFIAHELQAVVPDCVTGAKDAVETVDDIDSEGRKIGTKEVPRYQGVDTSFLVATLVAAIQELKSEFDAYKATHP